LYKCGGGNMRRERRLEGGGEKCSVLYNIIMMDG
jgi:hypothetical protein